MITVDDSKFRANTVRLARLNASAIPRILHSTMSDWVSTMQRLMPPKGLGQGKGAVARDIKKIWSDPKDLVKNMRNETASKKIKKYIASGDFASASTILAQMGYNPSRFSMPNSTTHNQYRNQRTGRVGVTKPRFIAGSSSNLKDFIKKVQNDVGKAKSGFNAALQRFGKKVPTSWVARHGTSSGSANEFLSVGKGTVEATNNDKGAANVNERMGIDTSTAMRINKSMRIKVNYELQKAISASGLA